MALADVGGFKRDTVTGALAVTGGGGLQAARADCGALGVSATADITVNWPVPFADTNYTVTVSLVEVGGPTANVDAIRQVLTKTASGITVRVSGGTTGYAAGGLFVHAIAVHD